MLSSHSSVLLSLFKQEEIISQLPYENAQKLYAIMDAVDSYSAVYEESTNPVVNKLANVLASNMIVDYNHATKSLAANNESLTINAKFIDMDKIKLKNDTTFDFSNYNKYIPALSYNAMEQVYALISDERLYTKEYDINVSFADSGDIFNQKAILNQDDLQEIKSQSYAAAQRIYSAYINSSDISTAFFCKSIKELSLDNIAIVYNENNPDAKLEEDWQVQLFTDYAGHYINSLIIQNIIKANTGGQISKGTINYQIENGSTTVEAVCKELLDIYYIKKQPPVEKSQVISDFGQQLRLYSYNDSTDLNAKTFDFTYSQNLNEFNINDDFYKAIVNDIYEEYIQFEKIFGIYYSRMELAYFFVERPFDGTTIILDNTSGSRYRQFDINVTGSTDCYIKLHTYDLATDTLHDLMLVAYIKHGESLQLFIPEGDYIFKYATGEKWYGDIHMFSDDGQYFAGSDVISVYEYMMTTTIELGNFDSGSIPTYSQTPDLF